MRATLTVLLLVCSALGCSASENANHSIRCDIDNPCPSRMLCYRQFCISDDTLVNVEVDASSISVEPDDTDGRVRQPPQKPEGNDGTSVLDGSVQSDAAPIDNVVDAQSGQGTDPPPAVQPPPDVTQPDQGPTTPDQGPTTPDQGPTTPIPEADAGPAATDAGRPNNTAANRALLVVCLPSCGSRSPACLVCLNGVLSRNPEVCSEAEGVDELVSSLCDFVCTSAACRGRR